MHVLAVIVAILILVGLAILARDLVVSRVVGLSKDLARAKLLAAGDAPSEPLRHVQARRPSADPTRVDTRRNVDRGAIEGSA